MMRAPYQTPKSAPQGRSLRLPPPEKKRRKRQLLLWGAGLLLGYLAYSFVGGETGLVRIRSLHHETTALRARKVALTAEADRVDQKRTSMAKDQGLTKGVT